MIVQQSVYYVYYALLVVRGLCDFRNRTENLH